MLVPVRNGAGELPGFLKSATGVADAIVALDDGSTDGTWTALSGSPAVSVALRHPVRQTYAGWDDGRNRQALLDAAAALRPRWILYLDVDERIEPDDAAALRAFLSSDALPGCAYGLRHLRMWGARYDPVATWVYRLFEWAPDLVLPDGGLHFNPIPVSIPTERWVRTTIRLRHLGADSPARIAARVEKYEAGGAAHGGLDAPPTGELRRWEPRPAGLSVIAPGGLEAATAEPVSAPRFPRAEPPERPQLTVLVPVRNGADDVPGFLESVARLTDTVVALDDGSDDDSIELLSASPLTRILVRTGRREGRWDDARNRQALLDAATALRPRWLLFLDIDERIEEGDAARLCNFVEQDALPRFAYGLRVCRMVGDEEHFDREQLVVYRLFAWEPGLRLPEQRLHLVPVPDSIALGHRLETTLRIQHHGSLTAERRAARHAKYMAEDGDGEYARSYAHLLDEPGPRHRFERLPASFPVLAPNPSATADPDLDGPALSAIVIAREDADRIERAVGAVLEQQCPEPFEVIVVVSGSSATAAIVRDRFGGRVRLIELAQPVLPGAARNAGLRAARGEFVSFPGSHVELPAGSLAARLRAHRGGAAMVTGSITNGTDTPAGWATYFIDHAGSLPGRPSSELRDPPSHCSYMRHHLEQLGGFPEHLRAGEDTVVNRNLYRLGYRARREQSIVLVHRSRCETVPALLRHHFERGVALGRILGADGEPARTRAQAFARYLPRRLRYTDRCVERWGEDLRDRYREVRPLVAAALTTAWLGFGRELVAGALRARR